MKQVLQNRSGLTVVRDVPAPACAPSGVLVRSAFSAISSGTERSRVEPGQRSLVARAREHPDVVRQTLDLALRDGVRSTQERIRRKLAEESAAGYSSVGRVIEVGPRVRDLQPGDIVACAGAGHANHAEVVSVPPNLCTKIPEGVPLTSAALTTIAAIALHAIRVSDVRLDERVAVIGCGLVGQIVCRLARCAGADVYALDVDPVRIRDAVAGGADHGVEAGADARERVLALSRGVGVDHAIVSAAASSNEPLVLGAEILRERGALTLVGDVPIEVPRAPLYRKELTFRVSRSYGPGRYDAEYEERGLDYPIGYVRWTEQRNMEAVLDLQARGRLSLADLIEEVVPVEEAARAYERLTGPPEQRPRGAIVLEYPIGQERDASRGPLITRAPTPRRPASGTGSPAVGFIGCGNFAREVLVPAFRASGARLEVVGGGSGPSADAAVRQLGFTRTAPNEESVIEDPGIDAVVISTRHVSHARLAARALVAGKHVFCEKPLALTSSDLQEVLDAATESNGVLAVGFNRRYSPLLVQVREFVVMDAGAQMTAMYRISAGAIPGDHWVHDLEQGGGRIIGEVCHFLDALAFVTGSPILEIHATGHGAAAPALQARDNIVVTTRHADGSVGTIVYVASAAPGLGKERLEVFGPGGIAVLDDYRSLELHGPSGRRRFRERRQEKGHRQEAAAFVAAVTSGLPPVPLAEVANVTEASFAVVESMRRGTAVELDRQLGLERLDGR
jgi:predicted dehydrogenase/threonine dehydrogenase-like Zn-dependent dehydrogenase